MGPLGIVKFKPADKELHCAQSARNQLHRRCNDNDDVEPVVTDAGISHRAFGNNCSPANSTAYVGSSANDGHEQTSPQMTSMPAPRVHSATAYPRLTEDQYRSVCEEASKLSLSRCQIDAAIRTNSPIPAEMSMPGFDEVCFTSKQDNWATYRIENNPTPGPSATPSISACDTPDDFRRPYCRSPTQGWHGYLEQRSPAGPSSPDRQDSLSRPVHHTPSPLQGQVEPSVSDLYASADFFKQAGTRRNEPTPLCGQIYLCLGDGRKFKLILVPTSMGHNQVYIVNDPYVLHEVSPKLPWEWFQYMDERLNKRFYHNWSTNVVYDGTAEVGCLVRDMSHRNSELPSRAAFFGSYQPSRYRSWDMDPSIENICDKINLSEFSDTGVQKPLAKSAYVRALYGDETRGECQWTNIRNRNRNRNRRTSANQQKFKNICGFYVFPLVPLVMKRALIIACSYPSSIPLGGSSDAHIIGENASGDRVVKFTPTPLPTTIDDALRVFDVLIARGWRRDDIVLLVDSQFDRVQQHAEGCRAIEMSNQENVVNWMGRMTSALPLSSLDESAALFVYFAGHGDQRQEFPAGSGLTETAKECVRTEDDALDEFIMLADYRRIHNGPAVNVFENPVPCTASWEEQRFVDRGMLVDNDINRLLCEPVFKSPNTQMIIVFDCCRSGTGADLPFELDESCRFWRTTGEAARDEESSGVLPMPWECGKGIVWCVSACRDAELAAEEQGGNGGMLTNAFVSTMRPQHAVVTFRDVLRDISESIRRKCTALANDGVVHDQTPIFSSSHCCSLSTRFFL